MGSLIKKEKKKKKTNIGKHFLPIYYIYRNKDGARNALIATFSTFSTSSLFTIDPSTPPLPNCFALFFIKGHFFYRGEMGSASRRTLRLPRDSSLFLLSLTLAHDQFHQTFYPPLCNFEIGFGFVLVISSISWVHLQPCAYSLLNRFTHPVDDSAFGFLSLFLSFFLCFYLRFYPPLITV